MGKEKKSGYSGSGKWGENITYIMRANDWSYSMDWFLWLNLYKPFKAEVYSISSDAILNTIRIPLLVPNFWDFFLSLLNSYAFGKETVQVIRSTAAEER